MNENEFWSLIDQSREHAAGDHDRALTKLLAGRPRDELKAFNRIYDGHLARAYRWDVWGAGYVIAGGMSDDSFDDFCDWLVGQGRDVFEAALAEPDSLADLPQVTARGIESEGLRGAAWEAYEATYDEELEFDSQIPEEPAGEEWDEGDVDALYPRLAAKFGA